MAKREAPEINAGSMADIAFLLLIFFLVTTTMDKDTAFLRKIPKKVEIPENIEIEVEKKNVYKITINNKQAMQVRDSILPVTEIENLHKRIKHFYLVNKGLRFGSFNTEYPYYSYATRESIDAGIADAEQGVANKEALPDTDPNKEVQVEYANNLLDEWFKKDAVYRVFAKADMNKSKRNVEMPEIDIKAHVKIEPFIGTDYSAYVAIQSEIQKALMQMRDAESTELFGITYTSMLKYYQQNALEQTPIVKQYKERLDLLETLYPERIIEVNPKK
ncbi:MAG: ExbD/TolR family protein [Lishizhenia sp.]